MKTLNDKVAIIVGASSGMGRACALAFAQEGAKVCALARREQELADLENEARDAGGEIFSRTLDARDRPAVMAAVEETLERYGRIDILLYATGINVKKRDVAVIEPSDWNAIIDTNLNGAFNFVQAVLPAMRRQQDGQIIMISSVSGRWTDFSGIRLPGEQTRAEWAHPRNHLGGAQERYSSYHHSSRALPHANCRLAANPIARRDQSSDDEDRRHSRRLRIRSKPAGSDIRSGDGLVPHRATRHGRNYSQVTESRHEDVARPATSPARR